MKFLIIILSVYIVLANEKININNSSNSDIKKLPISNDKAEAIIDYLDYVGQIDNIYQLLEAENINSLDIKKLKQYVEVSPLPISDFVKNQKMSSYKLEYWFSSEGSQENLSDMWLDRFFTPKNINDMSYDEIYALPNVSPIDAVGIMKQKDRGLIKGTFELKNSPGLSRYGYKNILDFVRFEEPSSKGFNFRYSNLFKTLPITTNPDEESNSELILQSNDPETLHRLNINYGNDLKFGLLYHQNMGESNNIFTNKVTASIEDKSLLGLLSIDKLLIGNFNVSFGQGVIIETTDFFSPRRTGYGFTKRSQGVSSDLSRSSQYVMNGVASKMSFNNMQLTLFHSKNGRDAIINKDGSFCSLITMQPRMPWGINNDPNKVNESMLSSVNEVTWGGNFQFFPTVSTSIGFTFYESLYDRVLDASREKIVETILGGPDDPNPGSDPEDCDNYSGDCYYGLYATNSADPEIDAMYSSSGSSPLWDDALSYRRIAGFNFSTVYKNIAIQGEYGELSKDNNEINFGKGPSAFVLNTFWQFNNLNLLVLYRNYDLEYDNPYQRSFSNYQRYKTTIFEDTYWLEDPSFGFLYSGNPQPQAEEGLYVASRYQVSRSLVTTLNWDTWNRKADNSKYFRIVGNFDWRPVFNYRFKLRQKWQARGAFNIEHPSPYYSRETRLTVQLRLSNYSNVELLYSNGYTTFSPRPRLTDNIMMGETMVGDIGSPDESIGFSFNHNFDRGLKIKFGGLYVDGFLWYIEDSDFRVFDEQSGAMHLWVSSKLMVSNNLTVNLKVSNTKQFTSTTIDQGQMSNYSWVQNPIINNEHIDYRIQIDYVL
ncbi:MAG: hypothetical protein CMG00_08685 [Candidatus Marinimicrobia bacterium]|nr:hypothetical protein [Candidatus Neomarinimicrobiota bacterium]|tara:strand:- start:963 stop:3434 length:2472 start_codon:yes stop_codon:yes gene_type:complete